MRRKTTGIKAATALDVTGIYVRISDDRESEELGVTRQEEDCRELAAKLGIAVYRVYSDNDCGASTKSKKPRPGYDAMIADARAGRIGVIIAYTSSRLTRRPLELEGQIQLSERHGVRFVYLRSPSFDLGTADGRQVARTLAANDAAEAERTGERVARATLQRAEKGKNHGGRRAYGFGVPTGQVDLDGHPIVDYNAVVPIERDVIRYAADQILSGVSSLRSIVADLNSRPETLPPGFIGPPRPYTPTATGRRWTGPILHDVVTKPKVAGLTVNHGVVVGKLPGEPILTEDVRTAILDRLNSDTVTWTDAHGFTCTSARRTNTGRPRRAWLGSGLYRCECGSVMGIGNRQSYRCETLRNGSSGGGHVRRKAATLDAYITDVVIDRLSRPDAVDLFAVPSRPDVDLPALRREVAALRDLKSTIAEAFGRGDLDLAEFTAAKRVNDTKLNEMEARLTEHVNASPLTPLVGADDVRAAWGKLSLDQQRAVVDILMIVKIRPANPGFKGGGFDKTAIKIEPR